MPEQHAATQLASLLHFWPLTMHASVVTSTAGVLTGPKIEAPSGLVCPLLAVAVKRYSLPHCRQIVAKPLQLLLVQ